MLPLEKQWDTVRNVTASADAGISPYEPFDVTPYADAVFKFFSEIQYVKKWVENLDFSSNDNDSAKLHSDLGFIPKIIDGKKGFKYCWPVARFST